MTPQRNMPSEVKEAQDENIEQTRYHVDLSAGSGSNRSVPMMIGSRRCYMCQQGDDRPVTSIDPEDLIVQISGHCKDAHDYLLPDTPLKEAVFRVILANGNEPITAAQISEMLITRWALSANRRDISPRVIQNLLDDSKLYLIVAVDEDE